MKCSLGISNFLFHEIFKFNIQWAEQEINLEFTFTSSLHGSPFYTQRVPSSCAFELLDSPANSPAVFSPCLLLSPSHLQLCGCNYFFFSECKSDHVIFFLSTFQWLLFGTKSKLLSVLPSAWLPSFCDVCAWSWSSYTKWKWSHSVVSDSLQSHVHGILQARILGGLPFPFPEDLPNTGIKPRSPALQADALLSEPPGAPSPQISLQALALSWNSSLSASLTLPFYSPFKTSWISTSS